MGRLQNHLHFLICGHFIKSLHNDGLEFWNKVCNELEKATVLTSGLHQFIRKSKWGSGVWSWAARTQNRDSIS